MYTFDSKMMENKSRIFITVTTFQQPQPCQLHEKCIHAFCFSSFFLFLFFVFRCVPCEGGCFFILYVFALENVLLFTSKSSKFMQVV